MLRTDLHELSRRRIREAESLHEAGLHGGSYLLSGLAIECALKACIAREFQKHEFPDLKRSQYLLCHDPVRLAKAAGLEALIDAECTENPHFDANWSIVSDWTIDCRYELVDEVRGGAMFSAVTAEKHGVWNWLRKHW